MRNGFRNMISLILRSAMAQGEIGAQERYLKTAPTDVVTLPDFDYKGNRDSRQYLDILYPDWVSPREQLPMVVYIHGGAWVYGQKETYHGFCRRIASQGYVVFNINYRIAPEDKYPAQILDTLRACEWVWNNGEKYHGDRSRIFFGGDSAGAHLASLAAAFYTNEELRRRCGLKRLALPGQNICGLFLLCGCYKPKRITQWERIMDRLPYVSFADPSDDREICRAENMTAIGNMTWDYPPCFLCSGEADPLHQQTRLMIRALEEKQIQYQACIYPRSQYPEAVHEFQLEDDLLCAQECRAELGEFMKRYSRTEENGQDRFFSSGSEKREGKADESERRKSAKEGA